MRLTRLGTAGLGLLGAGLLAGWLLLPLGAQATPRHITPPLALPTCTAGQLRVDKTGGQGFTGHREWDFALRNTSPTTCQLAGFPKIKLLDKNAKPINYKVVHQGSSNGVVVLHTWKRAKIAFVFTVAGPCIPHSFNAYGLRITAPGDANGLTWYAGSFGVCNASGSSASVTAVAP